MRNITDQLYPMDIDSSKLPAWANWIAQDEDGTWWCYEAEPNEQHSGWYENEIGRFKKVTKWDTNPNWRSTLIKITRKTKND